MPALLTPLWGGARWGATSAWCALGGFQDSALVQSPESSQGAPRWAPPQSLWALWGGQAAQHAGRRFPAVAGTQAFREKPFVTTVAHPPSDPRGSLGRVSLFAVIKVFSRGKMVTFFHPEKGGTLANFFGGWGDFLPP